VELWRSGLGDAGEPVATPDGGRITVFQSSTSPPAAAAGELFRSMARLLFDQSHHDFRELLLPWQLHELRIGAVTARRHLR
jgi:hypothetical protein